METIYRFMGCPQEYIIGRAFRDSSQNIDDAGAESRVYTVSILFEKMALWVPEHDHLPLLRHIQLTNTFM